MIKQKIKVIKSLPTAKDSSLDLIPIDKKKKKINFGFHHNELDREDYLAYRYRYKK